jgi:hypothetical protein
MAVYHINDDMNLQTFENLASLGSISRKNVTCSDEVTFFVTYSAASLSVTYIDGRGKRKRC